MGVDASPWALGIVPMRAAPVLNDAVAEGAYQTAAWVPTSYTVNNVLDFATSLMILSKPKLQVGFRLLTDADA